MFESSKISCLRSSCDLSAFCFSNPEADNEAVEIGRCHGCYNKKNSLGQLLTQNSILKCVSRCTSSRVLDLVISAIQAVLCYL